MKKVLILFFLAFYAVAGFSQAANKILGVWWNDTKTSKIEIKEENGKYIGTVIYINPDKYVNGEPEKDYNNPDKNLRDKSRLGLQILNSLKYNAKDEEWQDGRIYDPDNGKTYDCYAWFDEDPNILHLKGYVVGIRWLGRSTSWTKVTD